MPFFKSIFLFSIATTATLVSSIATPFGFVRDKTCEFYGMHSIRDAVQCKAAAAAISAAEGLRTDTQFLCKQHISSSNVPKGCSYHKYGNIEQWGDSTGDCNVNGFDGCFCIKDSYGFVRTGTCESNGMQSIHNGAQCQAAAADISEAEGLRTDTQFLDKTHISGSDVPKGCSYHRFGNIEQWGDSTGNCDVRGFGGCFCIKDSCGSVGGQIDANMYLLDFTNKDILIMSLLVVNIFLFIYICCYGVFKKRNKSKPSYKTVAVYSTEDDEEKPINNL